MITAGFLYFPPLKLRKNSTFTTEKSGFYEVITVDLFRSRIYFSTIRRRRLCVISKLLVRRTTGKT
jgi:hypothetical protein